MLTIIILAAFALLASGLTAGFILLTKKIDAMRSAQSDDKGLLMLNQNIQSINEQLHKTTDNINIRLEKTSESINERLTNAARVIASVQKELGTVQERFKGFEEFNELLHPKMRGNIGEQILADMLAQVFPTEQYQLQFKFKGGETVDAVIRTQAGLIPIDSKFPLENFKQMSRATNNTDKAAASKEFSKAVKKHIDDISKKYLLPDEGTLNFAVMYVPSENVYYHILTEEENELMDYAKKKSVHITSPHGFFNFLKVIMIGMERGKLQEQAQKIWEILKGVQQESVRFSETIGVLSRHITNAKGAMDSVHSGYARLSGKIDQVKLLE